MKHIDVKTANEWLKKDDAVLIDVREPAEHASVCIECAELKPLSQINSHEIRHSDKKVIIHCKSGKRSQMACQVFMEKHPELDIYNLEGGIDAWQSTGLKVKSGEKKILPLDQQVQLTIGSLTFIGALLTFFININFVFVPAALGLGLTMAGLTGACPLRQLIAKMPWNQCLGDTNANCKIGN